MSNPSPNSPADNANYLKVVREHYENYPYPPRDPERERCEFNYSYVCALDTMNHYGFGGGRDFSKSFRALVAGGGTGDSSIMLAEQFRGTHAEIVHLDISDASMRIAKKRAEVRKLTNITWVHGSLLDAPRHFSAPFDYINCVGVLHHLASPEAGLAALSAVLKDDGVMGLMLYAQYGREGVYQIQNLMRLLNHGEENLQQKVENCKAVLKNLPKTSGFKHVEHLFRDVSHGDVGIYDLFLHSNDVAYTVPQVYSFLASSGLKLNHLLFTDNHDVGNDLYRLESYFPDGALSDVMKKMSCEEKQAAAELMHGKIVKHSFYASKNPAMVPQLHNLDLVPYLCMLVDRSGYPKIVNAIKKVAVGQGVTVELPQRQVRFIKGPFTERLVARVDGTATTGDILRIVRDEVPASEKVPSMDELFAEFASIYNAFLLKDCMYLRQKSVPPIKSMQELMLRMLEARGEPVR